MAFIIKDRVKEGTTSTGTGAITLSGSLATFDTFQSYMTNGDTTYYAIVHTSSGVDEWEVGLGTWNTGNTLTRTTVLAGSNGTSAENFSAGSKDVFMTYPAAHAALAGDDVDFANITVTGTVDGRDVATDGSKLDTVEQNADVTDAINVAAAGALMKSGGTMTGNLILNGDPTVALGAATKEYVDTIAAAGIHYHTPVRVEAPLNLTVTYNNGTAGVGATLTNAGTQEAITIDGVALSSGDRVLVYEQTDATQNGIYTVTTVGDGSTNWVLTRATDADSYGVSDPDAFGEGDAFFVKEGATGAGELYVMNTSGTITFGTTNITFTVIAETAVYSAGTGLTLTGTTFAIGQDVGTTADVTFNQVTAAIIGNVTGNVTGDVTGNAGTATKLATARNIALSGDVTGSASFDGSANISIIAAVQDDSHSHVISNVDGLQTALNGKTPTSRTITAGNGLTGGGDLTANRTLNVGAGTGVTVNADTVAIGQDVGTSSNVTFNDIRADGGNLILGDDAFSTSTDYVGMKTAFQSGTSDYMMISGTSDGHTYVSAKAGSDVHIRGGGNTSSYEIRVYPDAYATAAGSTLITEAGGGLSKSSRTLSHADTSSQASVDNSNGTVIQDITLDTYGHITGIASTNLDGRYYTETEADSRFWNASGDLTITGKHKITHDNTGTEPYIALTIENTGTSAGLALDCSTGSGRKYEVQSNDGGNLIVYDRDAGAYRLTIHNNGAIYNGQSTNRMFADNYHPNADKWTTARTLSLSGDASGSVSWDGSANATLSVAVADNSHNHQWINDDNPSNAPSDALQYLNTQGNTTDSPTTDWYNTIRMGHGNPNTYYNNTLAMQMTGSNVGALYGRTRTNGTAGSWNRFFADNYHPNADKWTTARTLSLSGEASGSVSWDGSANANLSVTLNHNALNDQYVQQLDNATSPDYQTPSSRRIDPNTSNPTNEHYAVMTYGNGSNVTGQLATHFVNGATYNRAYNASWSAWSRMFDDDYHPNADKWTTARTLTLSGDASGSVTWDGSADVTLSVAVADDSHNHVWGNIDGASVSGLTGPRFTTPSGYIEFGPANATWAHIYTDRPNFYFNKELYVNNNRVYNTAYHPEADKWTTARTLTLSGDASGSVSWDGSANATLSVSLDSDVHKFRGDITSQDWNTLIDGTETGYYTVVNGTGSNKAPSYMYGTVVNWAKAGQAKLQLYGPHNGSEGGNGLWFRTGWNTDYDPWAEIWHSNNDGSGSGLDADLLDGFNSSQTESANTVAVRSSAGYLFSNYFNGTGTFSTTGGTSGMALFTGTNGTDTYGRSYTAAAARTLLNVENGANNYSLPATPSVTGINIGSEVNLAESSDRADLLQITSSTSGWAGLQIRNSSNEGRWSFMTDGSTAGFYDDENSDWALQMQENGGVTLYHNSVANFTTGATYMEMYRHLDLNNYDIYGVDQLFHHGDTNTYMQFHAEDQWRVVTGGSERLEVNNSQITSTEPIYAPSFHGDGSALTGLNISTPLTGLPTGTDATGSDLIPVYDVSAGTWEKQTITNAALQGPAGADGADGAAGAAGVNAAPTGGESVAYGAPEVSDTTPETAGQIYIRNAADTGRITSGLWVYHSWTTPSYIRMAYSGTGESANLRKDSLIRLGQSNGQISYVYTQDHWATFNITGYTDYGTYIEFTVGAPFAYAGGYFSNINAQLIWTSPGAYTTTYGAVGTYVFGRRAGSSVDQDQFVAGSTYAGSTLYPAGISTNAGYSSLYWQPSNYMYTGDTSSAALSGTWRAMGTSNNWERENPVTLFVRIS